MLTVAENMMKTGECVTRSDLVPSTHPFSTILAYHLFLSTSAMIYKVTGQMTPLLKKNRVQFLCLHHVCPDEEEPFRRLLRTLSRNHHLIGYSEAVERIWSGTIDGPYLALSFDDGLKNCLSAAQILDEFGVKACFFVCPPMIGETDQRKTQQFFHKKLGMPSAQPLTWDDTEALLKAGHDIGGHTLTHPNLAQLLATEIQTEVGECFRLLTERLGSASHFAWPYGRFYHFNAIAARTIFETGFKSCASVERGCHISQAVNRADLCIRRTTVVAKWPTDHVLALLARDSQKASAQNSQWPVGWPEIIQDKKNLAITHDSARPI